jgi:3',5'-cyclic AMP phosphodiesterase CpdA
MKAKQSMERRAFLNAVAGGALLLESAKAQAQPGPADGEDFCYCVVADPHCEEGAKDGLTSLGIGLDKFMLCIEAMSAMDKADQPDFILLAGDIHPWKLKERIADVPFPIHAVAGNHEATKDRRNSLRDLFPDDFHDAKGKIRDYYSFVHQGVRFIGVCDAGMGGEHVGQLASELILPRGQCEWIEKELAQPEARKVLFAHIPPELEGKDRNMHLSRNDSRWFLDLVRRNGPELMFFGHVHLATEERPIGDTRSVNLRSCCWNFNRAPIGFMHVRVTKEGMKCREIITAEYV